MRRDITNATAAMLHQLCYVCNRCYNCYATLHVTTGSSSVYRQVHGAAGQDQRTSPQEGPPHTMERLLRSLPLIQVRTQY